jgi:hypothetical protein
MPRLPEDCRVSVIDGTLVVKPTPPPIHQRIARRLAAAIEVQLPSEWQLETDVDVLLAEEPLDYLTPDVVVFDAGHPLTERPIPGAAVSLVVEVVSKAPGAKIVDRNHWPMPKLEFPTSGEWRVLQAAPSPCTAASSTRRPRVMWRSACTLR